MLGRGSRPVLSAGRPTFHATGRDPAPLSALLACLARSLDVRVVRDRPLSEELMRKFGSPLLQ